MSSRKHHEASDTTRPTPAASTSRTRKRLLRIVAVGSGGAASGPPGAVTRGDRIPGRDGRRHPVRVMQAAQRVTRIARVHPADILVVFGITGELANTKGSWGP